MDDDNCILLVDMVEGNEPVLCSGTIIVSSAPNRKKYKQLSNEISRRFVMNCWSLEELKAVWSHSYQHIPWKDVEKVYSKTGGIIRYVLEQSKVADDRMEEERRARNVFIDMSKTINQHISFGIDAAVIHRVVHIYSPDHSFHNSRYVFASNHARQECLKGLESDIIDRVMRFLESNTMKDAQGYCGKGNVFEPLVHTFVAEHGLPNVKRLTNAKYQGTNANGLLR